MGAPIFLNYHEEEDFVLSLLLLCAFYSTATDYGQNMNS